MPPDTRISVVICAYTEARWNDLAAALYALDRQRCVPHEIILVVDHNPALLCRAQRELSGCRVVANREPPGLSGARNSGIASARGEIVAFIDEDALAEPGWLSQLAGHYADPRVMGVGGAIVPLWQTGRPRWFPPEFDWVVGCTYRGMPTAAAPVRNLIGCNMSLRREVFESVGGFRSGIGRVGARPVGCEETELCIRARQRWPERIFLYDPRARVHHRVPAQRSTWTYYRSRCYAEGLSKALVSQLVGAGDGLSNERAHALRTLPQGALRGLADAALRGDPAGLARTAAIGAGLAITSLGLLVGTFSERRVKREIEMTERGAVGEKLRL